MKRFRHIHKHIHKTPNIGGTRRIGKGGSSASAGGFAPMPGRAHREGFCQCPPLIPGWPDAEVKVAVVPAGKFWKTVGRPFVFRIVAAPGIDNVTREEEAAIEVGLFTFVVRPGQEDADIKALADMLREQGGPTFGDPVDMSGADEMLVQIVAVLPDPADEEAKE